MPYGFGPGRSGQAEGDSGPETRWDVNPMAGDQKAKAKAEQAKGKLKETMGRAVGNEKMEAEGRMEGARGDAREAKEKAKDTFKH